MNSCGLSMILTKVKRGWWVYKEHPSESQLPCKHNTGLHKWICKLYKIETVLKTKNKNLYQIRTLPWIVYIQSCTMVRNNKVKTSYLLQENLKSIKMLSGEIMNLGNSSACGMKCKIIKNNIWKIKSVECLGMHLDSNNLISSLCIELITIWEPLISKEEMFGLNLQKFYHLIDLGDINIKLIENVVMFNF